MANLNGFDANAVEPLGYFEPVPAGKYKAQITASEMKPTKQGDGSFLELEFTIVDGAYKGRKMWDRLNLNNPNAKAVEIAKRTLSSICRAVNVLRPADSVALHNIPLMITVKMKKREDNGEMTNEIKGYSKCDGGATASQTAQGGKPPWTR